MFVYTCILKWFFQLDDSTSLFQKWLEITKHPLINGCLGYQVQLHWGVDTSILSLHHKKFHTMWGNTPFFWNYLQNMGTTSKKGSTHSHGRKLIFKKVPSKIWMLTKNSGFSPQIIHFNWGFPLQTIHFGVPLFLETPKNRTMLLQSHSLTYSPLCRWTFCENKATFGALKTKNGVTKNRLFLTHRIHGTAIFTVIYHKNQAFM